MEAHTEVQGHPLAVPVFEPGRLARTEPLRDGSITGLADETRRRDRVYRRLLGLADVVASFVAAYVAITRLGPDTLHPQALLVAPGILIAAKAIGLYDRDELLIRKTTVEELPRL